MAGTGNDSLIGGPSADFLFGGAGNDQLYAAGGSNYLKAGAGADNFVFSADDIAIDTVVNFKEAVDHMTIHGSSMTAQQLIQGITSDSQSNAVLHLSPNHNVTLIGVSASQFQTDWFTVTS